MEKKAENERAIALRVPGHPALSDLSLIHI